MPRPRLVVSPVLVGSVLVGSVLIALVSGCSSEPPVAASSSVGMTAPDDAVHGGSVARAPLTFGATSTDAHGLSVTVAAPRTVELPPGSEPVQQWPGYVSLVVTLANAGTDGYDPQSLFVALTSGDGAAEQVFGEGATGAPTEVLAPGASVSFPLVFGVDDPGALSLEIAPDFTEPTVLYRS